MAIEPEKRQPFPAKKEKIFRIISQVTSSLSHIFILGSGGGEIARSRLSTHDPQSTPSPSAVKRMWGSLGLRGCRGGGRAINQRNKKVWVGLGKVRGVGCVHGQGYLRARGRDNRRRYATTTTSNPSLPLFLPPPPNSLYIKEVEERRGEGRSQTWNQPPFPSLPWALRGCHLPCSTL